MHISQAVLCTRVLGCHRWGGAWWGTAYNHRNVFSPGSGGQRFETKVLQRGTASGGSRAGLLLALLPLVALGVPGLWPRPSSLSPSGWSLTQTLFIACEA